MHLKLFHSMDVCCCLQEYSFHSCQNGCFVHKAMRIAAAPFDTKHNDEVKMGIREASFWPRSTTHQMRQAVVAISRQVLELHTPATLQIGNPGTAELM